MVKQLDAVTELELRNSLAVMRSYNGSLPKSERQGVMMTLAIVLRRYGYESNYRGEFDGSKCTSCGTTEMKGRPDGLCFSCEQWLNGLE